MIVLTSNAVSCAKAEEARKLVATQRTNARSFTAHRIIRFRNSSLSRKTSETILSILARDSDGSRWACKSEAVSGILGSHALVNSARHGERCFALEIRGISRTFGLHRHRRYL